MRLVCKVLLDYQHFHCIGLQLSFPALRSNRVPTSFHIPRHQGSLLHRLPLPPVVLRISRWINYNLSSILRFEVVLKGHLVVVVQCNATAVPLTRKILHWDIRCVQYSKMQRALTETLMHSNTKVVKPPRNHSQSRDLVHHTLNPYCLGIHLLAAW